MKILAAVFAAALLALAGCRTSPYDYAENWVVREDAVRQFSVGADVFYLQGGLYKATANHSVGYYGMLVATGEDMDDPGELTIDLNGKTVTHGNTPHFGSSAVRARP